MTLVTKEQGAFGVKSLRVMFGHRACGRRRFATLAGSLLSFGAALGPMPRLHSQAAAAPAAASAPGPAGQAGGTPGSSNTTPGSQNTTAAGRRGTQGTREGEQGETRNEVPAGSQDRLTEFQQMVVTTTGRSLPIFGASLFGNPPSTFAQIEDVPVGPGYVIGPGDDLRVQISGTTNRQLDLVVDRTGAVSVPDLGAVHVAGLTYGQLPGFLNDQLGKIYRNFQVSTTLGSLRTIQVFVLGEARRPGTFSISSLSTLINAIFASGGVLPDGTLRDIQVRRDNVTIDHFDLYDLLQHGDKSHDIPLVNGDVIFVPPVGPQVAILGSVDNPAIYELKGATTITDLLQMTGGPTPVASTSTVRLERIDQHTLLQVQDVPAVLQPSMLLQNGDIVSVTSIVDRFRNAVTLRGNVANPGRYVWHQGMRISDLVPNKESLITRNYWQKRNELGQLVQDYIPGQPQGDEGALGVKGNAQTASADAVAQRGGSSGQASTNSEASALTANNGVFSARNDVVLSAPDINWSYAVIERQSTENLSTSLIPFDLGSIVLDGKSDQNFDLLPGDVVTIFSKADLSVPSVQQTRYVRLEGEFNHVGVYSVLAGETLRGLLRRAGGFTPDAYLYASEFTRESTRRVQTQRLNEYADQLQAQISNQVSRASARAVSNNDQLAASASAADAQTAVNRLRSITPIGRIVLEFKPNSIGIDSVPDVALEDGDRFVVPHIPANVTVEGQVYSANAFVYSPGLRVGDYLHRAGGPDRQADKHRIFLLRADGSVISQQYTDVRRATIYPGDTVVVPPILDKRAVFQRVLDITGILGNLGLGLAGVALLVR